MSDDFEKTCRRVRTSASSRTSSSRISATGNAVEIEIMTEIDGKARRVTMRWPAGPGGAGAARGGSAGSSAFRGPEGSRTRAFWSARRQGRSGEG